MPDNKPKILYVEDDETLNFITSDNLKRRGYEVVTCINGLEAWGIFQKEIFDICILDVMLPKLDGFSLAKKIRTINFEIPIIFITAKTLQEDKIEGLMLGADDYILKPFSLEEIFLKIQIFLRRSKFVEHSDYSIIAIGKYYFDFEKMLLKNDEKEIKLTYREAQLLKFFIENKNKLVTRETILISLWGSNDYFNGRSLDVFISRLRKYLKDDKSIKIENRHGVGYVFKM